MAIINRDKKGRAHGSNGNKTNVNGTGGRPTIVTPEVLAKLEFAFSIDATTAEACSYAEISQDTLYYYFKKNPKFYERVASLRERPVFLARQTVINSLVDPGMAFKYLERKKRNEFGDTIDVTSGGEKLVLGVSPSPFINGALKKVEKNKSK